MRTTLHAWILCLALAGCREPEPAPTPLPPAPPPPAPVTGPEVRGLRASIAQATGAALGSLVEVNLVLEWTTSPSVTFDAATGRFSRTEEVWLLGPSEQFTAQFWSAEGKRLDVDQGWVGLPEAFRRREERRLEATMRVSASPAAATVSLSLGGSGLETVPATIVRR